MTVRPTARNTLWALLLQWWPRSPFWRMTVLVPGILLLLVPVFMDKTSGQAVALAAVLGIAALVLPFWMNIYIPARDKRKSVLDARNEVLEPLRMEQPEGTAALKSFLPRWSRSGFYGRQEAKKRLSAWLKSASTPVMVIDGGPLVGKKRLAIEWADSLGPEWEAGWLRHDRDTEALQRIAAYGRNTIIVVDGMPPHLSELVHDLSRHQSPPQIRVLLTVRNAQGLHFRDPYAAALVQDVQPLHLGPIGQTADRERWFEELCRHYADRLAVPVPPQRPGFIQALGIVPIGVLHVAALAAARTGAVPFPSRSIEDLLFALWKTETDSWRNAPETPGSGKGGVSDSQLERLGQAVVALSLLEPRDIESGAELLERIPALSGTDPGIRKDIAGWAGRMYPPTDETRLGMVEFSPRIVVAAAFLHAPGNEALVHALLSSLAESEALVVLGRLVEFASLLPSAAAWAAVVVDGDAEKLAAAIEMALAAPPGNPALDQELSRCVISCNLNEDQAISLKEYIPDGFLPITNLALQELRVKQLRDHVAEHAGKYEPGLASALTHLAVLLQGRGRSADALKAAEESGSLYRRLAAENPTRYEPQVAGSLNDLGNILAEVGGRTADALKAAEESVAIWRRLTAANPEQHEPGLGAALINLVARIVELGGRTADALKAAEESVAIWRRLAAQSPARYEPELAGTLNNLALMYETGGRRADALKAAEESVAIRRRLAAQNPTRYEPELAGTLNNLGNRLADAPGRRADALKAAEESTAIWRRLVAENPRRYEPDLAGTLTTLGNRLADAPGRRADALKAAEESTAIWRRLAAQRPTRYEPDFARTLNNLALMYETGGRRADALKAAEESVALYRRLAAENPARYEPDFAGTLNNLAIMYETGGRRADAVKAAEESVALYRRLAAENPALYEPDLAGTLTTLGNVLAEAESRKAALVFWKESMQIYERLTRQDPRFREPLTHVQRMVWERT